VFYASTSSEALRFGDVVSGYVAAVPTLKTPLVGAIANSFTLEVARPPLLAVMSPCCSIGEKMLLLAPLIEIKAGFLDNPYFAADLTRINRPMRPEDSVAPHVWEMLSDEEKARRIEQGESYALLSLFVYEHNDLFPEYDVNRKTGKEKCRTYMIDFRHSFRLNCEKVRSAAESPLDSKMLELTISARSDLREKIAYFYSRVPNEDAVAIAAAGAN
jgi:hypothetical protein